MTYEMNQHQVRMARVGLRLSIVELASLSGTSTNTLVRLEAGEALRPRTVAAVRSALETAGARFVQDGEWVGVKIRQSSLDEAGVKDDSHLKAKEDAR